MIKNYVHFVFPISSKLFLPEMLSSELKYFKVMPVSENSNFLCMFISSIAPKCMLVVIQVKVVQCSFVLIYYLLLTFHLYDGF